MGSQALILPNLHHDESNNSRATRGSLLLYYVIFHNLARYNRNHIPQPFRAIGRWASTFLHLSTHASAWLFKLTHRNHPSQHFPPHLFLIKYLLLLFILSTLPSNTALPECWFASQPNLESTGRLLEQRRVPHPLGLHFHKLSYARSIRISPYRARCCHHISP